MAVDEKLLALLRCPACENRPTVHEDGGYIVCDDCGRRYPVEKSIPRMIVSVAEPPAETS